MSNDLGDIYKLPCIQYFWFPQREVTDVARTSLLRLFCFVHAGGNPTVFRSWLQRLPRGVQVCPVVYPGRGKRAAEQPLVEVKELAAELVEQLEPHLCDLPFAFFGHSLGTRVALEVTAELRRRGLPLPQHLYLSGAKAPHLSYDRLEAQPWEFDDEDFLEMLRDYGGTPPEVLANEELMAELMPTLRADFKMGGEYVTDLPDDVEEDDSFDSDVSDSESECGSEDGLERRNESLHRTQKLRVPVSLFGGSSDPLVSKEDLLAWRLHCSSKVRVSHRFFPGGHFYLFQRREFLRYFIGEMKRMVARVSLHRSRSEPALSAL